MATKRLYRTMVEGGHAAYERDRTRWENRRSRHATRQALWGLARDPDRFDGIILPISEPSYDFDDPHNHGGGSRWLAAHVGEEWGSVVSALARLPKMRTDFGRWLRRYYITGQVRKASEYLADMGFHEDEVGIFRGATYHWPRPRLSVEAMAV